MVGVYEDYEMLCSLDGEVTKGQEQTITDPISLSDVPTLCLPLDIILLEDEVVGSFVLFQKFLTCLSISEVTMTRLLTN